MSDLETRIADALRHRPDPDVHVDALTGRAVAVGRTRKRRAVAAMVGLVVLASAGVAAGILVGPPRHEEAPAVPREQRTTHLPSDRVSPTAAEQPSVVGTDPGVLHFDLDGSRLRASSFGFRTAEGQESISLTLIDNNVDIPPSAEVRVSADPLPPGPDGGRYNQVAEKAVKVGGRPATVRWFTAENADYERFQSLTWEPVAGLHAQVQSQTDLTLDQLLRIAAATRFDRAQFCVAPVRMTALPAGTRWTGCGLGLGGPRDRFEGRWTSSRFVVVLANGGEVEVDISAVGRLSFEPNGTVAGRPSRWEAPTSLRIAGIGPFAAEIASYDTRMSEADATTLGVGIIPFGDLEDMATWAVRPLSL